MNNVSLNKKFSDIAEAFGMILSDSFNVIISETTKESEVSFDERITKITGGIETRMGGIETRMGGIETRIGGLETRIGSLEEKINS